MYKTFILSAEDALSEWIIVGWDGECFSYTICANKEEYDAEIIRRRRVQEQYEEQMRNYRMSGTV